MNAMAQPIRVLVVDDSAFMRRALARRIELDPRFKVIETASDGQDGVAKALQLKPDVVTLDVEMPVLNGIDALKSIVARSAIPVVMVSAQTDAGAKTTMLALEIGAVDFVPKARGFEQIHRTLLAAVSANMARRRPSAERQPAEAPRSAAPLRASVRLGTKAVVIGSSTGGPQALQQVIGQLPASLNVPVVVAQHMPQHFTLALAKRLDEACAPKVVEARDGEQLAAGVVYIAPGGQQLRVTSRGAIDVAPEKGESLYRPSIDVLMESALGAFGRNVLGVMLTGMGNDGAREFARLKQAGGYVIAQDEASCVVYGMPRAVAQAGAADEVLPLDRIGYRISELVGR